ncbi:MAG TPA: aminotransferase class V-fold PLP-dependent enzyme [Trebonia sp.]|nr:aminotransferase class V-fold PLP-dependent enzyme [Trebonia sp.]
MGVAEPGGAAPRAMTRADAAALDAADPLGCFRDAFLPVADAGVVAYLDGNSLGRPPAATLRRLEELVRDQWGTRLIRGWSEGWFELPCRLGDELAAAALGAAPGQVILGDSTTVWLYKLLRAAVAARPGRREIVTDVDNFPTDRYVAEGIAAELGCRVRWLRPGPAAGVTPEQVRAVAGPDTAVVTLSHVAYRSAFLADMAGITAAAHEAGALVVWDLCHSAGSVPVALDECGADFAVGCTYKFLCGGPGAPAFAYVAREHLDGLRQPIQGWIGHGEPFAMEQGYRPAAGIARLQSGTPPILGLAGAAEGIRLVAAAGIGRIRAKAVALTEMAVALADAWLAPHGITLGSPRDPRRRGGHVTLCRGDASALARALIDAGVIVDYRPPDGIRVGLSPLSTGYEELWLAMDVMREVVASR